MFKIKRTQEEMDAEDALLDEMKARCDNWARCYRDRPRRNISITLAAMEALKKALYDPEKDEEKLPQSSQTDPYQNVLDQRDADILEEVWSLMAHEGEADLKIGDTGLDVLSAKNIVFLYAFGNERARRASARHVYRIKFGQFNQWEREALLFLGRRVRLYESVKAQIKK